MDVLKVFEYATLKHEGQFRNDNKTPYIVHPVAICNALYRLKITSKTYLESDLIPFDYSLYAIALTHDILENTNTSYEELVNVVGLNIANNINKLTFKTFEDNKNIFAKAGYLKKCCELDYEPFIIKIIDRICNVKDFINSGNIKYAKIYFHKADILFDELFHRIMPENKFDILFNEVLLLNNVFGKNK